MIIEVLRFWLQTYLLMDGQHYSGSSCVWAANRLGLVATAELLKLSSYDVW